MQWPCTFTLRCHVPQEGHRSLRPSAQRAGNNQGQDSRLPPTAPRAPFGLLGAPVDNYVKMCVAAQRFTTEPGRERRTKTIDMVWPWCAALVCPRVGGLEMAGVGVYLLTRTARNYNDSHRR